jgi:ABC-2 type transport system permease protein
MSEPSSPLRAALAQLETELRLTARRGENVLVTAVVPPVILLFFASVDVLPIGSRRPVDVLLPGTLALAIVATGLVSLGIATAYERSYGVLKRLGGSPLSRSGLIAAKVGAVLVIELLQVIVLMALAWLLLDWRPAPAASAVLFAGAIFLGTATFAGLGLLMAGTLRAEATLALANALFLATLLLGGAIVPIDQLPVLLAAIATVLPGAALSETFGIAVGGDGDALRSLAILVAWGFGAIAGAARTFRWE